MKKKRKKKTWLWILIVIVGISVAIGFFSKGESKESLAEPPEEQSANETPEEERDSVEVESLPEYKTTGPVGYGTAGEPGNKYWINVPVDTPEAIVSKVVEKELQKRKGEKVQIGTGDRKQAFNPAEITFFVYNKINPFTKQEGEPGKDIADLIYEWTPSKGLVKNP